MKHHTAAHIVFAAARKVLGPHVWQQGAKKTTEYAHLDISHFEALSFEQEQAIEKTANQIVCQSKQINKTLEDKKDAELEHGYHLYQGGVVPGNTLRVVEIESNDVEACCGTHCDSTSQVGWIKIISTKRIADGVVRIQLVAGEKVFEYLQNDQKILSELMQLWGIPL